MSLLDFRHAIRVIAKHASVTAIVVFTLALGIGASTAIFSVVYGVLLRPLPYPRPDRLVAVTEVNHRGRYSRLSDPNFSDFRERNHTFSAMAKYTAYPRSVAGGSEPTRSLVASVSGATSSRPSESDRCSGAPLRPTIPMSAPDRPPS